MTSITLSLRPRVRGGQECAGL